MTLIIGVLHGCCQNADMIENLLKSYIKKIKNIAPDTEFHFIDAQYVHHEKGRMWYRTPLDLKRIGSDDIPTSDIEDTLDYIEAYIKIREINCLIGFSQGANVVSTYLRTRNSDLHIERAAIISGYDFPKYTNKHIHNIPLVFVYSKEDDIVNHELTPITLFPTTTLIHNKGHIICNRSSFVTNFITALLM